LRIPEEDLDKIFTLFVSTGGRTGLGLPVSQKIVKEHGGDIRVVTKLARQSVHDRTARRVASTAEQRGQARHGWTSEKQVYCRDQFNDGSGGMLDLAEPRGIGLIPPGPQLVLLPEGVVGRAGITDHEPRAISASLSGRPAGIRRRT
jgi:hypothetical protein